MYREDTMAQEITDRYRDMVPLCYRNTADRLVLTLPAVLLVGVTFSTQIRIKNIFIRLIVRNIIPEEKRRP